MVLIASLLFFFVFALGIGSNWLPALSTSAAWQRQLEQREPRLEPRILRQIESLAAEKRRRTPAQRKISPQLLYAARMHRGLPISKEVRTLETDVVVGEGDRTVVDIRANITGELIEKLHEFGVQTLNISRESGSIRASIKIDDIEAIAALSDIINIGPKQLYITSRMHRLAAEAIGTSNSKERVRVARASSSPVKERGARIREYLSTILPRLEKNASALQTQPAISIEGDAAHRVTAARNQFGFNGTGIKIGVVSDGAVNLKVSQSLGALGKVTVLNGQTGENDEGTAMLEIIHALAPGAELYFATALDGMGGFAQNIRELRRVGCDIIVDDILYLAESVFQDGQAPGAPSELGMGLIAQAVNDVTRDGALYFSSAGNGGNLAKSTSGVWEGAFLDGGIAPAPLPGRIHSFGANRLTNQLISAAPFGVVSSMVGSRSEASANDYDLYILNSARNHSSRRFRLCSEWHPGPDRGRRSRRPLDVAS